MCFALYNSFVCGPLEIARKDCYLECPTSTAPAEDLMSRCKQTISLYQALYDWPCRRCEGNENEPAAKTAQQDLVEAQNVESLISAQTMLVEKDKVVLEKDEQMARALQ